MRLFFKISKSALVFTLIFVWMFSGWPQVFEFPPKIQEAHAETTDTFTLLSNTNAAGYGSWVVPAGVTSADWACWGGGGGGGDGDGDGAGGGGGGAFASSTASGLTEGEQHTVYIGAEGAGSTVQGGDGGNGGNSTFATSTVIAAGGTGGTGSGGGMGGGPGGTVVASTGATRNAGGVGGNGVGGGDKGGGGGGAAGPHGDGGAGSGQVGGDGDNGLGGQGGQIAGVNGTDHANGGGGGAGGANNGTGGTAGIPGGGGGGGEGNGADGGGGQCTATYTVPPSADPALEFGTHRWFQNVDSTEPGRAAMLNQPIIAPPQGTPFRLRFNLHVKDADLTSTTTKLQFANKVGSVCGTPGDESYSDVTTGSAIRFYNNSGTSDNSAINAHSFDPRHSSTTGGTVKDVINLQNYNDGGTDTTFSSGAINQGEDGLWDASLVDFSAIANTSYCFLVVQSGGGLLGDYGSSALPEIRTAQEVKVRLRGTVRLRMVRLR